MWRCTRCGEEIGGQAYGFCWKCGASRQSAQSTNDLYPGNSPSPVQALFDNPVEAQLITCPTCKAEVSSHAAACPRCGQPMRAPIIHRSAATHRQVLEEVIHPYKYAGYQVVQQTEYSITMVKHQNNFSVGTAVLLWLLFWPAGLWYTVSNRNSRDKVACFRVLPDGRVEISGDGLGGPHAGKKSNSGWVWLIIGAVVFFVIIMALILGNAG
jgi:hypothetical protein